MNNISNEQLTDIIKTIYNFKQLIREKGSEEEKVQYLMYETGLPRDECEIAFNFYNSVNLP